MNTMAQLIPEKLSLIAQNVLTPATGWLLNPVMPAIFWLAAIDAGKTVGLWGTLLGGRVRADYGKCGSGNRAWYPDR